MNGITYDVRVFKTETRTNTKGVVTSYRVRWSVAGTRWNESFSTSAQADAFRSEITTAARRGDAFSLATGRPVSWKREETRVSWYAFTLQYVDAKWPYAAPNHRRGIAEALIDATEMLTTNESAHVSRHDMRAALRWAYSDRLRQIEPTADVQVATKWLEDNTVAMDDFAEQHDGAALARRILDRISRKMDGALAAPNTTNRKRMVVNNAMEYAHELGLITVNPFHRVKWVKRRTLATVDPRTVINPEQARRLLDAVRKHSERGQRLVAFFACMYYAALRPEEVSDLRREHLVSLPDAPAEFGEMRLTNAVPHSGGRWTDSGKSREHQALKHRPDGETRSVPIHPELVDILRHHLDAFPSGPDGRVFVGPRGGHATDRHYFRLYHEARAAAFTAKEAASPLAEVPYSLRHACVSTWLNAGVPAPQVAEWAGHSVDVLLRVYAKCIDGQQHQAMRRIWDATHP